LDSHRFKRLQVLLVSNEAHFLSIVVRMITQIDVPLDAFDDMNEGLEEFFVLARVKRLSKLLKVRDVANDGEHIGRVDDVLLNGLPVLDEQPHNDSVEDEVLVLKQLHACKSGNAAQKKIRGLLKLTDQHAVYSLKNLQLVLLVPISAFVDLRLASGDVLLEGIEIVFLNVH